MQETISNNKTQRALPFASALREALHAYNKRRALSDCLAGITVGLIAIPLAMALAIASGVPPQHGLYTAIIAGAVIALCGGSRVNVSGPTAAFVVILLPIVQQFGLSGLLLATMLAGLMLIVMGASGLGRLVQYIPFPVTAGFTAGIGVVIASLQLKDIFGLHYQLADAHFLQTVHALLLNLPHMQWQELALALFTLTVIGLWPRTKIAIPGFLVALLLSTLAVQMCAQFDDSISFATIATRFSFIHDGVTFKGIPDSLPMLAWPWQDHPELLNLATIKALLPPAFAIALLCAIESLLCAVVSDGLSGYKHDSNAELIGQGFGNLIAPLFGGITATAAIARTATNVRSGATSPVAALIHALIVMLALLLLGPYLAQLPMAALAALLLVVAWNMADIDKLWHIIKTAPRADLLVLISCFLLTVLFDMVLAVELGLVLAALLFIKRMSELSGVELSTANYCSVHGELPKHVAIYDIRGPLFFGAAEQAVQALSQIDPQMRAVILNFHAVPTIDLTGIVALRTLIDSMRQRSISVHICALQPHIGEKLRHAGLLDQGAYVSEYGRVDDAIAAVRSNATP